MCHNKLIYLRKYIYRNTKKKNCVKKKIKKKVYHKILRTSKFHGKTILDNKKVLKKIYFVPK